MGAAQGSAQPGQGPAKPNGGWMNYWGFYPSLPFPLGGPSSPDPLGGPSRVPPHLAGAAALGLGGEDAQEVVGGHVEVVVSVGGGEDPDLQREGTEGAEQPLDKPPKPQLPVYGDFRTKGEILGIAKYRK